MHKVYLLLGSNEGERETWLLRSIQLLEQHGNITSRSTIYETEAWGLPDQPDFLNMAVCLETQLSPQALLRAIQLIEQALERQRTVKWGQRTLDIDIIFYDDDIINLPDLKIPHPYLQERRFALVPLSDIAANFIHPVLGVSVNALLTACPDQLPVHRYTSKSQ